MSRILCVLAIAVLLGFSAFGQQSGPPATVPPPNQAPPHSTDDSAADQQNEQDASAPNGRSDEESSSTEHRVDIRPPKDDAKNHPFSASAEDEAEPSSDVQEFHPWDPHKAAKDVEVGEFYLKRKNYRAAEARFREALVYKSDDAIATYRLGEALEKQGRFDEARAGYEGYLKILPQGVLSQDARKAIDRLSKKESKISQPK